MLGLEYATNGTMTVLGRKIVVIEKDDQSKPDIAKSALASAYGDDKVDLAIGPTSSASALAMLPVAEEYKKLLLVEPAVADSITGDKWNRYIFRTGRNSTQDAVAGAVTLPANAQIAMLAQDYAFGRDGVKAFKEALAAVGSKATIVHEEYVPQATTDFTAPAQRMFDALKDKQGTRDHRDHLGGRESGHQAGRHEARALQHRARARRQHPAGDEDLEGSRRRRGRDLLLLRVSRRTR